MVSQTTLSNVRYAFPYSGELKLKSGLSSGFGNFLKSLQVKDECQDKGRP